MRVRVKSRKELEKVLCWADYIGKIWVDDIEFNKDMFRDCGKVLENVKDTGLCFLDVSEGGFLWHKEWVDVIREEDMAIDFEGNLIDRDETKDNSWHDPLTEEVENEHMADKYEAEERRKEISILEEIERDIKRNEEAMEIIEKYNELNSHFDMGFTFDGRLMYHQGALDALKKFMEE